MAFKKERRGQNAQNMEKVSFGDFIRQPLPPNSVKL